MRISSGRYADSFASPKMRKVELRVCPETSGRIAKLSQHQPDRCEAQERQRLAIEVLPVLRQSSAAVEPGNGAFDNPTFRQHRKALRAIGALDDLYIGLAYGALDGGLELRPLI